MHTSVSRAYILCTLTYLTLQSLFAPLFSHSGYFIAVGIICAHGSCVRVCVSLMPLAAFYFSHAPPRRRVIHFLHVSRTREVCACILQKVKGKINTHSFACCPESDSRHTRTYRVSNENESVSQGV
jgi:hypothetical protein